MAVRFASLSRPGLFLTLLSRARLAFRLLREPAVPLLVKGIPLAAALYLVVPFDAIPDVLPLLGELDDLGFILVATEAFLRLCPADASLFHRAAIAQGLRYSPMPVTSARHDARNDRVTADVIDAEWRRE